MYLTRKGCQALVHIHPILSLPSPPNCCCIEAKPRSVSISDPRSLKPLQLSHSYSQVSVNPLLASDVSIPSWSWALLGSYNTLFSLAVLECVTWLRIIPCYQSQTLFMEKEVGKIIITRQTIITGPKLSDSSSQPQLWDTEKERDLLPEHEVSGIILCHIQTSGKEILTHIYQAFIPRE